MWVVCGEDIRRDDVCVCVEEDYQSKFKALIVSLSDLVYL